jgi:hypothetical protein
LPSGGALGSIRFVEKGRELGNGCRNLSRAASAAGVLAAAATLSIPARAEPSVEDIKAAEQDFNHGRDAYRSGSYAEAAEYFESADSHAPNEKVLELAINARDKAGNPDRAATLAQLGLELYPNSERIRKVAGPLVDRASAEQVKVAVECSEPCSLLDGTRIIHGAPAMRRVVFVTPGDHTIRAGWSDDRTVSKDMTGDAGGSAALSFTTPPIPVQGTTPAAPSPAPGPDHGAEQKPHGLPPVVFFIGAGATVALGGVTIWSGIDTKNNPGVDAVRDACSNGRSNCQSLYDDGRSRQMRTNILIGATGVVGVATAVIGGFLTNWSGSRSKEGTGTAHAGVTPWISYANGPAVGATGRF